MKTRTIPGYPAYTVTDRGDVIRNGRALRQRISPRGYPSVQLSQGGKVATKCVHRLVALSFIANPRAVECVDHVDGNKENNKASNLRWVSSAMNTRLHFMSKRGRMYNIRKTRRGYRVVICFGTYPTLCEAAKVVRSIKRA